ncbi:hypothetical protein N3K66_002919 [Trichothecium roseum]|uniref:Uncharacterized protein n=1 Tax=Trichothecium roseum TaxID=47278 RepID=A0ACC0V6J6_9HYPO|nr:hypothetical protein N3K66_002919 [Trichothecium roseum]
MGRDSAEVVNAVFEHLVLPPKVTESVEEEESLVRSSLGRHLRQACATFCGLFPRHPVWEGLHKTISTAVDLNQGFLDKHALMKAFREFCQEGNDGWLVLHLETQNAALIIYKSNMRNVPTVVFEAFRVSVPSATVLDTEHTLTRDFPDRAVSIPLHEMKKESFITALATFLEGASSETFDQFSSRGRKAGKDVVEIRDPAHPVLITNMLLSLLEGMGTAVNVTRTRKRTRDDTILSGPGAPWRRCPYWLVLQVSTQRFLYSFDVDEHTSGRLHYKFLMCVVLADFLEEGAGKLHPEKTLLLQKKLRRRLAKLEEERSTCTTERGDIYTRLFAATSKGFENILNTTKAQVGAAWESYKRSTIRRIPLLPERAPYEDTQLRLTNSRKFLRQLLTPTNQGHRPSPGHGLPSLEGSSISQIGSLSNQYGSLSRYAKNNADKVEAVSESSRRPSCEQMCIDAAESLMNYMTSANNAYNGDSLLMSRYLLSLFELWVTMDKAATKACPNLLDYHPIFVPEMLDPLCLLTDNEMARLQAVQKYINTRVQNHTSKSRHMLTDPKGSHAFPGILYVLSDMHTPVRSREKVIDMASAKSKEETFELLRERTENYDSYTQSIQDNVCCCSRYPDGRRDVRGCTRCYQWRCRKKLKIAIHEDFLPEGRRHRYAILLELQLPRYLDAYRSATWRLRLLGLQDKVGKSANPELILEDFENLKRFWSSNPRYAGLTLASEKKSFTQTHYNEMKLPKRPDEVTFAFGPSLRYYDKEFKIWVDDFTSKPSYRHLLGNILPKGIPDPYSSAEPSPNDEFHRPSSYEIVAKSQLCPLDMSIHELGAMQRLFSSRGRRWLVILVELASSNMNLSSEATMVLLNHMALQAGPAVYETGHLREAHTVLLDPSFCRKLHEKLQKRLDGLVASWREVHCMSILVTLSLRAYYICSPDCKAIFQSLLMQVRDITSAWITHLRGTIRSTDDAEVAKKYASYTLWAALLCRQTYAIWDDPHAGQCAADRNSQIQFFRASIALQESLLTSLDELPRLTRMMLIRDLIMAHDMRKIIKRWFRSDCTALEEAINETWTNTGASCARQYSTWNRLPQPSDKFWVVVDTTGGPEARLQVVHYHLLHGHLLIDGKAFSKLPLQMREDDSLKELFENRHLLTCPSSLQNMQYQLVTEVMGHTVHFGMRHGKVIIRAWHKGFLYEHVPRTVFKGGDSSQEMPDLPLDLLDECVHWLNLKTGQLEMRRKPDIWKHKASNWTLDVNHSCASRNTSGRNKYGKPKLGSRLVEPTSTVAKKVSVIFHGFEDTQRIIVFQPVSKRGNLTVEMKRLEISFSVNRRNILECRQLGVEIDPNQDIGTLYGLASHLVCRNMRNSSSRSVLVPDGEFSWQRKGIHVVVRISNTGTYARFFVDVVLGRLTCPPDLRLMYLKASLHALTSFPIADTLTQRTGTEQALDCLASSQSQPWEPLQDAPKKFLDLMRRLTPKRERYPPGIYTYQKVTWDSRLTMTIQHEGYDAMARQILRQSQQLEVFHREPSGTPHAPCFESTQICPMGLRGMIRRATYERHCVSCFSDTLKSARKTRTYAPSSEGEKLHGKETRVYKVVKQLLDKVHSGIDVQTLAKELGNKDIGGFDTEPATLSVPDLLSSDLFMSLGSYIETCRQCDPSSQHSFLFIISILAMRGDVSDALLAFLSALAICSKARNVDTPRYQVFRTFTYNEKPDMSLVERLILSNQAPIANRIKNNKQKGDVINRHKEAQLKEASTMAAKVISFWNASTYIEFTEDIISNFMLESIDASTVAHIDLNMASSTLGPALERLYQNMKLTEYLRQATDMVHEPTSQMRDLVHGWRIRVFDKSKQTVYEHSKSQYNIPELAILVASKRGPKDCGVPCDSAIDGQKRSGNDIGTGDIIKPAPVELGEGGTVLEQIANNLIESRQTLRSEYGRDLQRSIAALAQYQATAKDEYREIDRQEITAQLRTLLPEIQKRINGIQEAMASEERGYRWLGHDFLWPCTSMISLLSLLRGAGDQDLHDGMKRALVDLALAVTALQRLHRMHDAICQNDSKRLRDEQAYKGHTNWSPMEYPDWVLLEADNDLLIRETQVDVAEAIISPQSGTNSVLQMNMGQGKTSCILPMAIAVLADRQRLCRIIVPKALLFQTAQILQSRLGGLVGRTVSHIPFSRRSPCSEKDLAIFQDIHAEAMHTRGVVICLPEHILSFKMSGLQKLVDDQVPIAKRMVGIQSWLDDKCRDVMDESDFILSPKTQLIYPSGTALPVDGHPNRWHVIEELLSRVQEHLPTLQSKFKGRVEIIWRQKSFPIIHLVDAEVENALNELLIDDVCAGRLTRFRLAETATKKARKSLRDIIKGLHVPASAWENVKRHITDDVFGTKVLYLLRGLISQRILLLCLSKLWNVHFGLHPDRAPIAVPFEAKGVPSDTAEYGHPDTAIILTYLAFYQTGFTQDQMTQCLQYIMISDDPAARWEHILGGCDIPDAFQHWSLVNLDDGAQMEDLWSYIRFDKNVLNYYVQNFVFPRHAKQFGVKLQSSGWDIPLDDSRNPGAMTTGFSGTNDNKRILPETIQQDDLPSLLKTNAEVLGYLLEQRNNRCYKAVGSHGRYLTETELLELLCKQKIRVLIDSGSYILEMENHDVAAAWLKVDVRAKGAVYFDRDSRIMVRARFQKASIPLHSSSFADNLSECVVYIDQRHTRGTDLKLPLGAVGAVTLGLGQTKDQTVQAAMRLRQLGSTQSLAFVAPSEVYRSILDLRPLADASPGQPEAIGSADVVRWLIEQSCLANENAVGLRVAQGMDYCERMDALQTHGDYLENRKSMTKVLEKVQRQENQSLEALYGPQSGGFQSEMPRLAEYLDKLTLQKRQMETDGRSSTRPTALQEVEQEREVEFEVEEERQTQRPYYSEPLTYPGLHGSLLVFSRTGSMGTDGPFIQAFDFLGGTAIGSSCGIASTGSNLFVSEQFTKTVEKVAVKKATKMTAKKVAKKAAENEGKLMQAELRPVEWVLWCPEEEIAIVVIPEEAERLIPVLRNEESPRVWLLSYAPAVTKAMQPLSSTPYCFVPPRNTHEPLPTWLSVELNVFAGGLHFRYEEYKPLLSWLGVDDNGSPEGSDAGEGGAAGISSAKVQCKLPAALPLKFLLEWLTYRRQTEEILYTPMGFVCQRKPLQPDHQFFVARAAAAAGNGVMNRLAPGRAQTSDGDEDDDEDSDWEVDEDEVDGAGHGDEDLEEEL